MKSFLSAIFFLGIVIGLGMAGKCTVEVMHEVSNQFINCEHEQLQNTTEMFQNPCDGMTSIWLVS